MMKLICRILILFLFISSCSRDSLITEPGAKISLSTDELNFDTVFTATGSATRQLKIFNDNNKKLRITSISLRRGQNSYFSFNADGQQGPSVQNLEINARDSIYMYVTVKIDPGEDTLPFVVNDTIDISFNGNLRTVTLSSWGQNAYFLNAHIIRSDTTWTNKRPIVITGGVLVAEGIKLNIDKGARIYLHADAPLIIEGSLVAEGDVHDSTKIIFQGDRLDRYYRDLPGSWPGIYFSPTSIQNRLENVIIRNAYQGLVSEAPATSAGKKLEIYNCIIENCYDAGIVGVNTSILGVNTLVSNCGKNMILVKGGSYTFKHCTNVAIGNAYVQHRQPALTIADFLREGDALKFAPTSAEFTNCIFWGSNGTVEDEVVALKEGSETFDIKFINCIMKFNTKPGNTTFTGVIENEEPLFVEVVNNELKYNFRLRAGSIGIDGGVPAGVNFDLDGKVRDNIPDIGAFESTF